MHINRLLNLPSDESLFLFGARATGKTTLLMNSEIHDNALLINLLKFETEQQLRKNPDALEDIVQAMPDTQTHVIIDEVQKIPQLLNIVHHLIETTPKKFILTGSSARKLKYGGANLLAGRAFVYHLYPFNFLEISDNFQLNERLRWGMLPKILSYETDDKRQRYLEAYTNTYLKEEVWGEQFIRHFDVFRNFLEVAAQSNGKLINFANIARDIGSSDNAVKDYFGILEDTLIGFYLNPYQHSFRKRLSKTPKFYFFDTGIVRSLQGLLSVPLHEETSLYGEVFEHFIILQCHQLANYYKRDYRFSYLATKDGAEIDLVVERPGQKILFIEIKSCKNVEHRHIRTLQTISQDHGDCESVCFSQDNFRKKVNDITIYPWQEGIKHFFT